MDTSLPITNEEHQYLLLYCNEWLGIWNSKYLSDHFIPTGNEPNFIIASQMNDILSHELANLDIL